MLETLATTKYLRTSAQKAKLVLDLIRGKKAADALAILRFTKKSIARDVEKTLRSAIANAVHVADKNQKRRLDEDDLVVSACYANQGPSQKRVRPAPMGRAFRVLKRTAHLTVHVSERPEKVVAVATDAVDKRPRRPQGKKPGGGSQKSEARSRKSEAGSRKSATKAKE